MDRTTLERIRDEHPTASWALWSPTFPKPGCVEEEQDELFEYIISRHDEMRPSIVLLSLNPSTDMPSDFWNFHSTQPKHRNDQFRDLVEASGLTGAFTTDLVEHTVDASAGDVTPTDDDVENFFHLLNLLGQDEYHVLCFLQEVFDALRDAFDETPEQLPNDIDAFTTRQRGFTLHCYRVWFHANWGANKDKIPKLEEQLAYLNQQRIDS